MNKYLLSSMAVAMILTFSACHQASDVAPQAVATVTSIDKLAGVDTLVDYLRKTGEPTGESRARVSVKPTYTYAQLWALFNVIDLDFSGQLSFLELGQFLRITPAQAQQFIKMFDANNSGMMEIDEFERMIGEILRHF